MMHHFYLALVGETRSAAGRPEDALAPVEQGLAELDTNGRFYEAELHRLKGELLSALGPARLADARASVANRPDRRVRAEREALRDASA